MLPLTLKSELNIGMEGIDKLSVSIDLCQVSQRIVLCRVDCTITVLWRVKPPLEIKASMVGGGGGQMGVYI